MTELLTALRWPGWQAFAAIYPLRASYVEGNDFVALNMTAVIRSDAAVHI